MAGAMKCDRCNKYYNQNERCKYLQLGDRIIIINLCDDCLKFLGFKEAGYGK